MLDDIIEQCVDLLLLQKPSDCCAEHAWVTQVIWYSDPHGEWVTEQWVGAGG